MKPRVRVFSHGPLDPVAPDRDHRRVARGLTCPTSSMTSAITSSMTSAMTSRRDPTRTHLPTRWRQRWCHQRLDRVLDRGWQRFDRGQNTFDLHWPVLTFRIFHRFSASLFPYIFFHIFIFKLLITNVFWFMSNCRKVKKGKRAKSKSHYSN